MVSIVPDEHSPLRLAGPLAIGGGLLWALAPVPAMMLESRLANVAYVPALVLLLGGVIGLRLRTDTGPVADVGYLLTLGGVALATAGSILEATVRLATLVEWGIADGIVFFAGLYMLLLGSLFLGIGLWRGDPPSRLGAALLVACLPVAVVGFRAFNTGGLVDVNWIPFTVPYGTAWIIIGYALLVASRGAAEDSRSDGPEQPA